MGAARELPRQVINNSLPEMFDLLLSLICSFQPQTQKDTGNVKGGLVKLKHDSSEIEG